MLEIPVIVENPVDAIWVFFASLILHDLLLLILVTIQIKLTTS